MCIIPIKTVDYMALVWLLFLHGTLWQTAFGHNRKEMGNDMGNTKSGVSSLSLDTWALIVALALALAVKFDILKNVPW